MRSFGKSCHPLPEGTTNTAGLDGRRRPIRAIAGRRRRAALTAAGRSEAARPTETTGTAAGTAKTTRPAKSAGTTKSARPAEHADHTPAHIHIDTHAGCGEEAVVIRLAEG